MTAPERAPRPVSALAVATCFGIGYIPVAPGTFGSVAGLLLWIALPDTPAANAVAILLLLTAGVWSGSIVERYFHSTDPGPVVIDEVMGMLVTLFLNPVGWAGAVAAFVLFRVFDIIKPYPANRLERLHGGFGVMADDFMAAVYANVALRIILELGN
jgi:phosphatidylglycerophosphatase A